MTAPPPGWGVYGLRTNNNGIVEAWLKKLPLPGKLPYEWPTEDSDDDVLGFGTSGGEAIRNASLLIEMPYL